MISEYLKTIENMKVTKDERQALLKIYEIFKTFPIVDQNGQKLIGEPKYLFHAIKSESIILDNIEDIIFKLKLDLRKHLERIALRQNSNFWNVSEWLYSHGWASNEYRRDYNRPTKWFGLKTYARNMQVQDKRKQAELELKARNAKKHREMSELARQKRYES